MTTPPAQPNIVLVMSDEQRWDTLGANGHAASVTPNIDSLAATGTSMDTVQATYPLCCPSRMSIWTGLMPHDHHGFGNWRLLRDDLRDDGLVHPFRDAGYHTFYNGKWHVPGSTPARFGFADVEATPAVLNGLDRGRYIEDYRDYAARQGYELVPNHIENLTASDVKKLNRDGRAPYGTAEIPLEHFLETWQTGVFLEQLDRRPADAPFLAVCSFNAPHFPMIVPSPFDRLVDPKDVGLPANALRSPDGKPAEVVNSPYHEREWPEDEWRALTAHYLGLCALVDAQVGRILAWLDARGLRKDTIVIFTSDHGDMMGSHSLNKKGYPLHYDEALRVPFVAAGPGIKQGHRSGALVSLMDLLPTLGDLAGVPIEGAHDGMSFAPALAGDASWPGRPWLLAESFQVDGRESGTGDAFNPADFDIGRDGINVSIRTREYRYVYRLHDRPELYDKVRDPHETANIVDIPAHQTQVDTFRDIIATSIESAFPAVARHIRENTCASSTDAARKS